MPTGPGRVALLMAKLNLAADDLLAYVANIPDDAPLASWSLRMPFIVDGLRCMARELILRRAAEVVTIPVEDIDDFEIVTKEMPSALLAHFKAVCADPEVA
jgi:hypothetical protein